MCPPERTAWTISTITELGESWTSTAPSGCRPGCPPGGRPYTTGSWTLDPFYGWTWVDTAPWGWAPYHYGRWVFVNGFWAWAPGPVVVQARLRAGSRGLPRRTRRAASASASAVLSWAGWRSDGASRACPGGGGRASSHRPWWGGWGGPRVVNNVVIQQDDRGERASTSTSYRNTQRAERRGGGATRTASAAAASAPARVDPGGCADSLQPIHTAPQGRPDAGELRAHGAPRHPASRGET